MSDETGPHPRDDVEAPARPGWPAGRVVTSLIGDRQVRFLVTDDKDHIQSHHAEGRFYESEEINLIGRHFRRGGVFVDIGANVGNHVLLVGLYLRPARVYVFEPHPEAIAILRANIELNGLQALVETSTLGYGLADRPGWAALETPATNLGATRLTEADASAPIPLTTGDAALSGRRVDFIKLDAEGMELKILEGLRSTIQRHRPKMMIEVDDANAVEFRRWLAENDYRVVASFRRYVLNENVVITPLMTMRAVWGQLKACVARREEGLRVSGAAPKAAGR